MYDIYAIIKGYNFFGVHHLNSSKFPHILIKLNLKNFNIRVTYIEKPKL